LNPSRTRTFRAQDYDLGATLDSGQAFRWVLRDHQWTGVIATHWVSLLQTPDGIEAETGAPVEDWTWLEHYLQIGADLPKIVRTFPDDEPMRQAVAACRGLRLLRQDPWECLASFILSSSKQIVQIRQIVGVICERYGESIAVPGGGTPSFAFPTAQRLAQLSEAELRACKMGFRAPYLLETARIVAAGMDLEALHGKTVGEARQSLMALPGVGRKVADCVLLFAYGFQQAFPVDVWVMKALQQLYFPRRRVKLKRLHRFAESHFGPYSGYAQQYLFHFMRLRDKRGLAEESKK